MKRLVVIILVLVQIFACRRVNDEQEASEPSINQFNNEQDVSLQNMRKIYYRFPAPDDIIEYISKENLDFNPNLPNKTEHLDSYITSYSISINLGVYIADLVYITLFKNLKLASKYFEAIEKLASQARLSSVFDEQIKRRVQENLNNIDSLNIIAKDSYNEMVNHMTRNGDEENLAIVSSGAYIETLFLILNQIESFEKNKDVIHKIYEQKYAIENLSLYMNDFDQNEDIKNLAAKLQIIIKEFNKAVNKNPVDNTIVARKNGSLVFSGGGYSIQVKQEYFESLRNEINKIRDEIIHQ